MSIKTLTWRQAAKIESDNGILRAENAALRATLAKRDAEIAELRAASCKRCSKGE